MLCIKPFVRMGVEHGCGQCMPCRVNRRRMWTARIVLESAAHAESSFVTMTYEAAPAQGLSKEDWRGFAKGIGYRYFGCGEYGTKSLRPHYHAVIFGLSPSLAESYVRSRWPHGFCTVSAFVGQHAAYVAGYVVKKLNKPDDSRLPKDWIPEFSRMSRRPAVGTLGLSRVENWLTSDAGSRYLSRNGDVPKACRIEGKLYPLGRTMVAKLRSAAGFDPKHQFPPHVHDEGVDVELLREQHYRKAQAKSRLTGYL